MNPDVSIVVPALNEEKRIKAALKQMTKSFEGQQIIVVSDGSTDGTADIVRQFKNVKLIESETTQGKGVAIVKGFRVAEADIVGFLDADGSFSPEHVRQLIDDVKENGGCSIASKWVGKSFSEVGETTVRKITSRMWNLIVSLLLGLNISDTQAGAKFLERKIFEDIDCEFTAKGFEFDVELLYLIKSAGYDIREMYIPFEDVTESTFRYSKTVGMFKNLMKIFLRHILG